jgi:hypothetical protein
MSEYVRKQELLDRLDDLIGYFGGNSFLARALKRTMEEIQSGAFDAEPDGEVQRLKVALAKAKGWIKYLVYIGQNIEPEMEKKAFDEIDEILSGAREGEGR